MNTHPTKHRALPERSLPVMAGLLAVGAAAFFGGCATVHESNANEPVGKTQVTEKRVYDTPDQRTTVTETHTKDTKIVR